MKRILSFILSFLPALYLQAQTKHTVSGYIADKSSKETLIGATILDLPSGKGTITNEYGYYSLTLPDGPVEIRTGYVGYKPVTLEFKLSRDTVIKPVCHAAVCRPSTCLMMPASRLSWS